MFCYVQFDVYDWNRDGSHDHIGGFTTCLQEMLGATQQEVGLLASFLLLLLFVVSGVAIF